MMLAQPPTGRIAVVGAGVFGVTAAIYLAREGWNVDILEAQRSVMNGATGNSVFRLHRGYHYPRSLYTAREANHSVESFLAEYGSAVIRTSQHLYAISQRDSRTTPSQFLQHCKAVGLEVKLVTSPLLKSDAVDLVVETLEWRVDPALLRELGLRKMANEGVNLLLSTKANPRIIDAYDFIVLCANARSNNLLQKWGCETPKRQFEVCEVAIMSGAEIGDTDIVIMDGPFNSLSPFGRRGDLHILYDVEHSVHYRSEDETLHIPSQYRNLLRNPDHGRSELSAFSAMLRNARQFVHGVDKVHYEGSMWSVRSVLADSDANDGRPTIVNWSAPNVVTVFSGKLVTAVTAAQRVVREICERQ